MEFLKSIASTSQLICGLLMTISYIPQIKLLIKTKSCENQSFGFWIILDTAMILGLINSMYFAICLGEYSYLISQSLNLLCGLIVLGLLICFKNNKSK